MSKYKTGKYKNHKKQNHTTKAPNFNRVFREDLLHKQNGECCYCYDTLNYKTVTLEHVKARSKGGINHVSNYKASCQPCNSLKGSDSEPYFLKKIKNPQAADAFPYRMAHIRRRLNLQIKRSCSNLRRYVGIEALDNRVTTGYKHHN